MFLEALAGLADDRSYTQDRVAAEATLETATQRLDRAPGATGFDYEPRPATSATRSTPVQCHRHKHPRGRPGIRTQSRADRSLSLKPARVLPITRIIWSTRNGIPPFKPTTGMTVSLCLGKGSVEMWIVGHGFNFFSGGDSDRHPGGGFR